jgi:glutamyl-tRNA synthetase
VQVILDGMSWLRLSADDGLYYPTRRYDRYCEVLGQMRVSGHA